MPDRFGIVSRVVPDAFAEYRVLVKDSHNRVEKGSLVCGLVRRTLAHANVDFAGGSILHDVQAVPSFVDVAASRLIANESFCRLAER